MGTLKKMRTLSRTNQKGGGTKTRGDPRTGTWKKKTYGTLVNQKRGRKARNQKAGGTQTKTRSRQASPLFPQRVEKEVRGFKKLRCLKKATNRNGVKKKKEPQDPKI